VAALKYSPEENNAPQIIGLGKGEIAEKILEKAKENNIPIYENEELAAALNAMNIGDEIKNMEKRKDKSGEKDEQQSR